jgi:hypothetical protein
VAADAMCRVATTGDLAAGCLPSFRYPCRVMGTASWPNAGSLESIDSTRLKALQTVGDAFLLWHTKLKSANLGGLERLESAEHRFMATCESLESIDTTSRRVFRRWAMISLPIVLASSPPTSATTY